MKEIALKSILLQFLRRKKLFSLFLIIPLLLGMAVGALRNRPSAAPLPGTDRGTQHQYMKLQLDALMSLRDAHQRVIETSIVLNMDPSKVATRRHTFFLDTAGPAAASDLDEKAAGRIGNYYAYYKFTPEDYAAYRQILGRPDLPEIYIDELVGQTYSSDLGLLTLTAVHPDQAVADRLGNYNYDRILRLYAVNTTKNHELKLIGQVSWVRTDETISQRLNDRITAIAEAQEQIDALRPKLTALEIVPDLNPSGGLAGSVLTWGILGLAGGFALALIAAAVMAAKGETVYDPADLEAAFGAQVLGFVPQGRVTLAERLIFGRVRGKQEYERILSHLDLELRRGNRRELTVVSPGSTHANRFLTQLQADLPDQRIHLLDRLDRQTLPELGPGSSVLLTEDPAELRSSIRDHLDLLRKSGSDVVGLVFLS